MNSITLSQNRLSFTQTKTYFWAQAFIMGNICLPHLVHQMALPDAGFLFLPLFFFTLVATVLYGWRVGLLSALGTPILNHLAFGMPTAEVLPLLLVKGGILVGLAHVVISRRATLSFLALLGVMAATLVLSAFAEALLFWNAPMAMQHAMLGLPAIILHATLCYAIVAIRTKFL